MSWVGALVGEAVNRVNTLESIYNVWQGRPDASVVVVLPLLPMYSDFILLVLLERYGGIGQGDHSHLIRR